MEHWEELSKEDLEDLNRVPPKQGRDNPFNLPIRSKNMQGDTRVISRDGNILAEFNLMDKSQCVIDRAYEAIGVDYYDYTAIYDPYGVVGNGDNRKERVGYEFTVEYVAYDSHDQFGNNDYALKVWYCYRGDDRHRAQFYDESS